MRTNAQPHTLALSQTNSYGYVSLCSCGWVGVVHPAPASTGRRTKPRKATVEQAKAAAEAEHRAHVTTDAQLTAHRAPSELVGVVLNTSRFGHR